jgi:hypothetical protein
MWPRFDHLFRLEHFAEDNLHDLLKHPVLVAFLELELTSLKFW